VLFRAMTAARLETATPISMPKWSRNGICIRRISRRLARRSTSQRHRRRTWYVRVRPAVIGPRASRSA
jgi:hypothetical protein